MIFILQHTTANHRLVVSRVCGQKIVCPDLVVDRALRAGGYACQNLPFCWGIKLNELIVDGQVWRLVTPIFLHADLAHILHNMYALFLFGQGVKFRYRRFAFLALYLLSGFAGCVISFLLAPNPALGASGAVFGIIGAEVVAHYRQRDHYGNHQWTSMLILAAALFFPGLLRQGVDNWGHLGGLLGGALFAALAEPDFKLMARGHVKYLKPDARKTVLACAAVLLVFGGLAAIKIVDSRLAGL
ncbi:MAG: rhomboid family intramembrane serine protease [Anaerolineales bacterium]|nr:rhomboid family intramembrane serine protease [Anaerolineales bacterium]